MSLVSSPLASLSMPPELLAVSLASDAESRRASRLRSMRRTSAKPFSTPRTPRASRSTAIPCAAPIASITDGAFRRQ
jgi:hypothetical protein